MKEKILSFLKEKKILLCLSVIVLFILIILFIIFNNKKITELEEVKIKETSADIINYIDEITLYSKDEGRYICFAIEYLYNTTDMKTISVDKVIEVINSNFLLDYDEKKIVDIGISKRMLDKGIVFDSDSSSFIYNIKDTRLDIANKKIIKYNLKEIKKLNKNKFKVTYDKFLVDNPYDIYNYYNDENIVQNEISEITDGNIQKNDLTLITDYLKGEESLSNIKDMINKDNIEKFGKIDGKISIIYIIKDNKLVIEKIV